VEFGERLEDAAVREFAEETGLTAEITGLLATSQVILPERPYHSITIAFWGKLLGGTLQAEADHGYGVKVPKWFSAAEVQQVAYHPPALVEKALGI
jgi:ADP-ribose pyrophosphatase YjhB (NUDIX family)